MMNSNEGVASRYGIREAVVAQHLWELGTSVTNNKEAIKCFKQGG